MVHEGGWRVEVLANGELQFYWPNGAPLLEAPPQPPFSEDPIEALRDRHQEEGLKINEDTSTPTWDGEPMDLDWVMSVLRQNEPLYKSPESSNTH
jgi:hypothetical protein